MAVEVAMSGRRERERRRQEQPKPGPSRSPGFGGLHITPVWNRGWELGLSRYTRTSPVETQGTRRIRRMWRKARARKVAEVKPFGPLAANVEKPADEKGPGFFGRVMGKMWGTQKRGM
jgi:hypothetical protein